MSDVPVANKLAEAQAIVRALAATPMLDSDPSGVWWCVLCDDWSESGEVDHRDDCVFARASRWAEAHPR